jgi:Tfp pilus assembly protein PilE
MRNTTCSAHSAHLAHRAGTPRWRRGLSKIEVVVIAAAAGLLLALAGTFVVSGVKLNREAKIRANLQEVWVIANQYFLETGKEEVALKDLAAYRSERVKTLFRVNEAAVAGEDYQTVNNGVVKREDKRLAVEYGKGRTVIYETTKSTGG